MINKMLALLLIIFAQCALAQDPIYDDPVRSRSDGDDNRVHVKQMGHPTDPTPGAAATYQVIVDAEGEAHVDVGHSVLPDGASTETTLMDVLQELIDLNTGQGESNTDLDAIRIAVQNTDADIGAPSDAAASTDTGTFSLIALIKRGLQTLTTSATSLATLITQTDTLEALVDQIEGYVDGIEALLQSIFDQGKGVQALLDTTNRTANQTVTSAAIDTLNYGTIIVSLYSSHATSFTVEWSSTGTGGWRPDVDTYSVSATSVKTSTYGPKFRYMRVIDTNGSTGTTTYELSVILKPGHTKPSSHKMSEAFNDSTDAEAVVAGLAIKRNDGTYGIARGTNGNILKVALDGDTFTRIKQKTFLDTEEVRYDIPLLLASGFIYTCLNTAGTATSSTTWSCVRTSFDSNGNPTRDQYRTAMSWDSRTSGW